MDDIEPMASNYPLTSFAFHQQRVDEQDDVTDATRFVDCVGGEDSLLFSMSSSTGRSLLNFDLLPSRCIDPAAATIGTPSTDAAVGAATAASAAAITAETVAFSEPEYCHLDYAAVIDGGGMLANRGGVAMPQLALQPRHHNDEVRVCGSGSVAGLGRPPSLPTPTATTAIDDRCVYPVSVADGADAVASSGQCRQQTHQQLTQWTSTASMFISHNAAAVPPTSSETVSGLSALPPRSTQPMSAPFSVSSASSSGSTVAASSASIHVDTSGSRSTPCKYANDMATGNHHLQQQQQQQSSTPGAAGSSRNSSAVYDNQEVSDDAQVHVFCSSIYLIHLTYEYIRSGCCKQICFSQNPPIALKAALHIVKSGESFNFLPLMKHEQPPTFFA
jgi:hypothetical protein